MTIYKKGIITSSILSVVSFLIALILNYVCLNQFWCNVMLGIFTGAMLNFISSIIGYFVERKTVLEEFYTETIKIVNVFNRYQHDLNSDQKIDFFLKLADYDTSHWDMAYSKIDLFSEKERKYVYNQIYKPLLECYRKSCSHSWHFRMHVNGTGKNDVVMAKFIDEIEPAILKIEKKEVYDKSKNENFPIRSIKNQIVENIIEELNGHYYLLMYGKKKFENLKKMGNE